MSRPTVKLPPCEWKRNKTMTDAHTIRKPHITISKCHCWWQAEEQARGREREIDIETYLSVGHYDIDNAFLNKIHFCTDCALFDNYVARLKYFIFQFRYNVRHEILICVSKKRHRCYKRPANCTLLMIVFWLAMSFWLGLAWLGYDIVMSLASVSTWHFTFSTYLQL